MQTGSLGNVVHTGLQTLVLMGVGWLVARRQWLKPAATADQAVSMINMLVMRLCLPALQLLLLAVHTDMRTLMNWRLLGAFMMWTAVIQAGCGVWVLLFENGRPDRWGLHALVLAANNTGILAPVVLDAALGTGTGYIGMLATVCLYFQQLPVSEALMAAGSMRSAATSPMQATRKHDYQDIPGAARCNSAHSITVQPDSTGTDCARQLYEVLQPDVREHVPLGHTDAMATPTANCQTGAQQTWDQAASCKTGHHLMSGSKVGLALNGAGHRPLAAGSSCTDGRAKVVSLLALNPLVWTTGVAAALSTMGSSDILLPNSQFAIRQLTFISGSLEWLARCSVPLTLLSTGLWLHGRTHLLGGSNTRLVLVYLGLKLFVLPWLMLAITRMMGIDGHHGLALLLLTVVPVGQTAFVISERYHCGTEAVTGTLIAGLLVMLPQLLLVLWLVNWLGLYNMSTAR